MILAKYKNGNVEVTLYDNGTKTREFENTPLVAFPESLDVKITNDCNAGCAWCHENSYSGGYNCHVDELLETLKTLPPGIEIALGGGNPLYHPKFKEILEGLKEMGFIANVTINNFHLPGFVVDLASYIDQGLIHGVGISIPPGDVIENISHIRYLAERSENVVFHVVAGLNHATVIHWLMKVMDRDPKILVLGYKKMGRGLRVPEGFATNVENWYKDLANYFGKCYIAFDNLAISQLNVKRFFTDQGWAKFYQGDDFSHTMFFDAVEMDFAESSTSSRRVSVKEKTLLEFFNSNRR
jgi:hypothetical protein